MAGAENFTINSIRAFQKKYIEEKRQTNSKSELIWIAPQNQLQQYEENLNKIKDIFQNGGNYDKKNIFKGNLQENVNFNLDSKRQNMSFFYQVKNKNKNSQFQFNKQKKTWLLLQMSVTNMNELVVKKPIKVYIIKHKNKSFKQKVQQKINSKPQSLFQSQKAIKYFKIIKNHQLIALEIQFNDNDKDIGSSWYQIFVSLVNVSDTKLQIQPQTQKQQNFKNQNLDQNEKHVSLLVAFITQQQRLRSQFSKAQNDKNQLYFDYNKNKNKQNTDSNIPTNENNIGSISIQKQSSSQIYKLLKDVTSKNDKIFLQSLQFWQTVKRHRQQHEQNVKFTYFTAIIQIFSIAVVFLLQFVVLKKMIKKKVII